MRYRIRVRPNEEDDRNGGDWLPTALRHAAWLVQTFLLAVVTVGVLHLSATFIGATVPPTSPGFCPNEACMGGTSDICLRQSDTRCCPGSYPYGHCVTEWCVTGCPPPAGG